MKKKTVLVTCTIQEGSIGYNKIKQLESVISGTYKAHFGAQHRLIFFWLNIPFGQSYIAGKLSTASTVSLPVADATPNNSVRHPFMSEICAKWQHITGCNKNEIILASNDMSHAKDFQAAMAKRFAAPVRAKSQSKLLLSMLKGYLKKGYLTTSVNT